MKAIAMFNNAVAANIAKGLLKTHDIQAIVHDDGLNQLMPIHKVRLSVQTNDVEKAQTILIDHDLLDEAL